MATDDMDASAEASTQIPSGEMSGGSFEQVSQQNETSVEVGTQGAMVAEPNEQTESKSLPAHDELSQPAISSNSLTSTPTVSRDIGNGASSYGTRSRNRAGHARPNYAEDKDMDEFELEPRVRSNARKGSRATTDPDIISNSDSGLATAKRTAPLEAEGSALQTQQTSGPSVVAISSTGVAPNNKKRKARGQSVGTQQSSNTTSMQNTSAAQAITRRASIAAQVAAGVRDSNMLSFDHCRGQLKDKKLVADDGTVLEVNDHVYLICEPPGEPYYLGRIMEFLHQNNDSKQQIDALRLNWYYRPKDIGRKVNDTRQIFASMHSDISPLTALRGKCEIKHRSELGKLEDVRQYKDTFWYEKLYDRYIHRFYDVIPTCQVINVPVEVKKVLDERWRYILVEPGRGKELTSAVKSCKRCSKYSASNNSVDCAVCQNTYHMSCVSPPLLKKPSRGFAWACGPCSKAQEKKLEARNTPNTIKVTLDGDEEDFNEDDFESPMHVRDAMDIELGRPTVPNDMEQSIGPATAEQIHQASLWLFRYLGIHCKVEDALDYDDRIYPRASSRLGPRHQANVIAWPGQPVEYVKPQEIRKKISKSGNKKDPKPSKEYLAAVEAEKVALEGRPKWVMDEPPGYNTHRGEDVHNDDPDNTARLLFKPPEDGDVFVLPHSTNEQPMPLDAEARQRYVEDYMHRAKAMANMLGLPETSTNIQDVALEILCFNKYNAEAALSVLPLIAPAIYKEPRLTAAESKKFEDGVAKFGSEWHSIKRHVKSMSPADIVRYYYTWKKSARGKQVWGNYHGRKGKKEAKRAEATAGKLQDDVADEVDDSAFDNDKAYTKKRGFQCKFCTTRSSRQWRRAPGTPAGTTIPENPQAKGKEKGNQLMVALCRRCAELWRRYAIQWEDVDEVARKLAQAGGRAWKRKIDDEILKELVTANEVTNVPVNESETVTMCGGRSPTNTVNDGIGQETPRKKMKTASTEKTTGDSMFEADPIPAAPPPKKKPVLEAPPPPPPVPPKVRILPCAICYQMEPMGDQLVTCKECRLTVHRNCYGVIADDRFPGKWTCDTCQNDKNPQVSIEYKCILCPVEYTEHDFVGPPKVVHKKKSEKDREKDRIERERAINDAEFFRKKQEEMNRPVNPREPLKRTANNNWVHVTCAVFTPEVKFGNAKALMPSEGIPNIPAVRREETCKVCKQDGKACVYCHSCKAPVHVECAHQHDYILGFDIALVKGTRRDQSNMVSIGAETGIMTASIWCKEHAPAKSIVHPPHEIVDEETGLNALQTFVKKYKQADLTLTGTVRKATLVNQSTKAVMTPASTAPVNRRASTTLNGVSAGSRASIVHVKTEDTHGNASKEVVTKNKCITCGIDVSPKWRPVRPNHRQAPQTNIANGSNGGNAYPDQSMFNGNTEVGGGPIALATAALHRNNETAVSGEPTKFQCNKCHVKQAKEEPAPRIHELEPIRLPPIMPLPGSVLAPSSQAVQQPPYAWPPASAPPNYPTSTTYNATWAQSSSTPPLVHAQLNGVAQQINGQQHMRPVQTPHFSPLQNGRLPHTPNEYPSPRPGHAASPEQTTNGYGHAYNAVQLPPQHLTNGGPPAHASEYTFPQNNLPAHSRPFGIHHDTSRHASPHYGSPRNDSPQVRDVNIQNRELTNQQQMALQNQNDGRVIGGASASPSLHNLLS